MLATDTTASPAAPSSGQKLAQNAFFLLAGQIASTALAVILSAALGRGLGVVEFGNYFLLMTAASFAYVAVEWGQSAYLVRESARRQEEAGKLLGGALAFRVFVGLAAALVTAGLLWVAGYDERMLSLALLAILCGLPLIVATAFTYVFRGRDRMDLEALVNVAAKAVTTACTVLVLLLGAGLSSVLLMQAVGGVVALGVAVVLARGIAITPERPDRAVITELAQGGAPIAVFFLALAIQPFLDALILAHLAPPQAVGWYGAARNIMNLLYVPAQILGTASFPELARVASSIPDLNRALKSSLRLLLGLAALGAVGTFLFADLAVSIIFGHGHFDPATVILQVFAPVLPLFFMDILFGTVLTALGKTKEIAVIKIISIAVSACLSLVLIPICQSQWGNGGIGLVLAFGAAEVMMLSAFLWLLPRGTVDRSALYDVVRAIFAAGGTGVIFWALPSLTPWLAVPGCVIVFLALALAGGLIRPGDLKQIRNLRRAR